MANRVEVTSAGYRKRRIRIASEGERDMSAVIDTDELTAQLKAADDTDREVYGDRGEPTPEGPPADQPVEPEAQPAEPTTPAEPDQAQTEPAPDQGDQAQTEQPQQPSEGNVQPTTPSE